MAKIKKIEEKTDSSTLSCMKEIEKKYGNVIMTGSALLDKRKDYKTIGISPLADMSLGGGIKEGSWLILSGMPKTGKTTVAMQMAYIWQQLGRNVIYINAEGRLKDMNFEIEGLDPSKMQIVTAEDKPISAEDFLEIAHKLVSLKENEGCLCIIDSVSSLIPAKDLEEDVSGMIRPGLPKILSNFTKKMGQIVPNQRAVVVMITHLITNTSGYGAGRMADSGVKIQFQSDTRLEVKSIAPWMQGDEQIGQAVTWKVWWSSVGSPGHEFQNWIRYGHGIDNIQEILMLGQEAGLISQAGAWFTCSFLLSHIDRLLDISKVPEDEKEKISKDAEKLVKLCKFQGAEKLYTFLSENPEAYEILQKEIKALIC
jgi:RecA/RadA recombinase